MPIKLAVASDRQHGGGEGDAEPVTVIATRTICPVSVFLRGVLGVDRGLRVFRLS